MECSTAAIALDRTALAAALAVLCVPMWNLPDKRVFVVSNIALCDN